MSQVLKNYRHSLDKDAHTGSRKSHELEAFPAPFRNHSSKEFLNMTGEEEKAYYDQVRPLDV